ncbi:hypothetical protein [Sporolactobacillus pectinivorans]|uniref:hypothetical protein n=1 Tax=Sporolactobacillus pectinivorans TaxID=1591408 RepID=UPI000C26752E|nr:hypothetical protein [Sporolactobacillus pectinivorans]
MIIVYLSLALVAAAIIGFAISAMRTLKLMNGTMAKVSKIGEKIRRQAEKIAEEKNTLTQNLSEIQLDYIKKKEKVQATSRQVQQAAFLVQKNFYQAKMAIKSEKA